MICNQPASWCRLKFEIFVLGTGKLSFSYRVDDDAFDKLKREFLVAKFSSPIAMDGHLERSLQLIADKPMLSLWSMSQRPLLVPSRKAGKSSPQRFYWLDYETIPSG